jgi:hypothetical protein
MEERIKNIGYGFLIFGGLLAIIFLITLFLEGSAWVSIKLMPLFKLLSSISFTASLIFLLPLTFFKRTRQFAGMGFIIISYIFGLSAWFTGFVLTLVIWGWLPIILGLLFLGIGVVPIALLATLIKGIWIEFIPLLITVILIYLFRLFGFYLLNKQDEINDEEPIAYNVTDIIKNGIAFFRQGEYVNALDEFNSAIAIDNSNKNAYYYRAITNHKLGNKKEILSDLRMAAQLGNIKSIEILNRKGITY